MSRFLHAFWSDRNGGPAAEFAMVLPVLMLFLFGIIDAGRLMWTWNQAEQATQAGARFAAATDVVPSGLKTYSYSISGGVPQGDPVPQTSFGGMTCDNVQCTCDVSGACPFGTTRDGDAFTRIVNRMARFKPDVGAANVTINYGWSGLGFAGDPNGPDVSPLITVSLRNLTFQPLVLLGAVTVNLPSFSATLSMEDGDGTTSN